jgi:alcohol dehydrogenase class IV
MLIFLKRDIKMHEFFNVNIPATVIGPGAIRQIGNIAKTFGACKILILTDMGIINAGLIDAVKAPLEESGLPYDIFNGCKEEPPITTLAEIINTVRGGNYDLLIGVGGGSTMDTTKVVSVTALTGMTIKDYISTNFHEKIEGKIIPKVLVPTTAGTGSEWSIVTTVYDHENGYVYPVHAWENIADKVIIDPELSAKMPQRLTADTGMDALAHAIESYTCPSANAFSDMLATTSIKMIAENLRKAYVKGEHDMEARYHMSLAAAFAMNAVGSGGIGLAHIINDVLGPKARVSHGSTVTLTLPAVMEYNMISDPGKFVRISELMGEKTDGLPLSEAAAKSVTAVRRLIKDLNLPHKFSQVGIGESDIPELAQKIYERGRQGIELFCARDTDEKDIAGILMASL